jgi:exodeoxyribonuclease VII small subunit
MSDQQDLSFAKAYDELQKITGEFETGELDLEKSIPKFKRAAVLVKFLKGELKKIESQIEEIDINDEQPSV